jgi:peptidylprolyl isomerase
MIQQTELKTPLRTRIIVAVIAVAMLVSTAALYFGLIVSYGAGQMSAEEEAELSQLITEYQDSINLQNTMLSEEYFSTLKPFLSKATAFNAADVTELKTRDLVVGDGREITEGDFYYSAYYIGWLSDETIFDSSFDDTTTPTKLISPLEGSEQLISGWVDGIIGMNIGGIREITIPNDLAYGAQDYGTIPAYSPLKFIVMLIDQPLSPEVSPRLLELYQKKYGNLS